MSDLRLDLDDKDFAQLVELGRSLIPTLAPDWTDHNIHDPGIMLIELMAWIADAQIYSLSRLRRDERRAYAAMLGLRPLGPRPAQGLMWPSNLAASIPWPAGLVIATGSEVDADYPDAPRFATSAAAGGAGEESDIQLISSALTKVETRFADGTTRDWTRTNSSDGATFKPFGDAPAPGDELLLAFTGTPFGDAGVRAPVTIGFEIVAGDVAPGDDDVPIARQPPRRLHVTLRDDDGERRLRLVDDGTDGLLHSGVLRLALDAPIQLHSNGFTIAVRSATGGFLRPPRVQRIAANVVPVEQREQVRETDRDFARGLPDQTYALRRTGLIDANALRVRFLGSGDDRPWEVRDDLADAAPKDHVFLYDETSGIVTFGNGVNGAVAPAQSTLSAEYAVSSGQRGNLPKDVRWRIRGVTADFVNTEALSGGRDAVRLDDLRPVARRVVHDAPPYVTTRDLTDAALRCRDLRVTRAIEILPDHMVGHVRGTRLLVIVGWHEPGTVPAKGVESAELLEEIRARLAPHLPLGQRLEVVGPRYIDVGVAATLQAAPNSDPAEIRTCAEKLLRDTFAAVAPDPSQKPWPFGRDLSLVAIKGWLRTVNGVASVKSARLLRDGREIDDKRIALGGRELPRLTALHLEVERWAAGERR